ncbi:MAG: hypothetical protein JWO87_840, partial [Phycisphaerales bacterium]|nr:hypothetical protein [Phycisphaerales bacterium]
MRGRRTEQVTGKDATMRACVWVMAAVLLCATSGFAEDQIKPEQLKKMYDDA